MRKPRRDAPAPESEVSEPRARYQSDNLPLLADVEDLRWKELVDREGEKIGLIEQIEADEESSRVEFLQVGRGGFLGFGAERFLVPVTQIIDVDEKTVKIDRLNQSLESVPQYEPDRVSDPAYCEDVRNWWCDSEAAPAS